MAQALDEFLDSQEIAGIETVPADEDGPERFKLTSLDAADWAFRKLAQEKARRAELVAQAQVQRDRIDAWLIDVLTPSDHAIEYFEGLLKEWAASEVLSEFAERQDWSKVRKTLSTPNGKVSARKSAAGTFSVSNADAAIETLIELGREDLVTTVYRIAAGPLEDGRDHGTVKLNDRHEYEVVTAAGELVTVPGIARTGVGQITFKVET